MEESCPICLCDFAKNDKSVVVLKCCNKQFRTECYIKWINIKSECPLCRHSFNTNTNEVIIPVLVEQYRIVPPERNFNELCSRIVAGFFVVFLFGSAVFIYGVKR